MVQVQRAGEQHGEGEEYQYHARHAKPRDKHGRREQRKQTTKKHCNTR